MQKMDYPKGLIRYTSGNGVAQQLNTSQIAKRISRPRVWIYCSLLLLVCTALVVSLSTRKSFSVDVIKDRGSLAREVGRGDIENVYRVQVMNGLEQAQSYRISVSGLSGVRISTDAQLAVDATGIASLPIRLTLPAEIAVANRGKTLPINFVVRTTVHGGDESTQEKSTFYVLP
jgi:polyferredoxin